MPTLETIGFIPQVAPLVILLIVSRIKCEAVLTYGRSDFAVRKQSSYVLTNEQTHNAFRSVFVSFNVYL